MAKLLLIFIDATKFLATMKTFIFLSCMSSILLLGKLVDNNSVEGKINFSATDELLFQRGTNYQDSTPSEEKLRIDALNHPFKNIYISLHPLDFTPDLTETKDANITQRAQTFFPNIIAITKGSTVKFINEDELYHNVYSLTPKARFNIGRRPMGNVYGQKINKVGVIKLGCDIHDDMSATILSLDTPYFTKIKEDGTYKITGLPDGKYEIKVYHPAMDRFNDEIEVSGGSTLKKDITLQSKA